LKHTLPVTIRPVLVIGSDEYIANADPTQIQQVVMNLAVNAQDAMPEGGELRCELTRIDIEADQDPPVAEMSAGEWIRMTISDTGSGMSEEVQSHLFEPFFTTKPVGEGTGLGLAQVYGIVKQHQGYIEVETELEQGTTFRIYLPASDAKEKIETKDEEVTPAPPQGQGETVLLVEDNDKVRKVGQDILESLGYQVLVAGNGREALDIYNAATKVDLVVTDIVMPEMGGKELIQELRKAIPDLRGVAITGHMLADDLRELRDQGILDVLHKPFDLNTLGRVVRRALDSELDAA
jgi:CheY-like chemotaxis protein